MIKPVSVQQCAAGDAQTDLRFGLMRTRLMFGGVNR